MQDRKTFTEAFKAILKKDADPKQKARFAYWFSQLDLSEGRVFGNPREEREIEERMELNLMAHINKNTRKFHFSLWVPATAAAILFIIGATLLYLPINTKQNAVVLTSLLTGAGERKTVTLSDGSVVTLNNSSRIKFPQAFKGVTREVILEGEAFFNVVHNNHKPFIVKTGKIKVHVLGTSFNLKNYITDSNAEVTVSTGKVGVQLETETHMLIRGQQLLYNRNTGLATTTSVNPKDYNGWQNGELIFRNESLENICSRMERWYGVRINIETASLKSTHINLEQRNESLQNVLKMLGKVAGFNYEIKDKNVRVWK